MSASLVGSEMCIRDREWDELRTASAFNRWVTQGRKLGGPARATTIDPATVSYTHLTLPTICSV
eukprot:760890-Alexandrium_andersonii.AAC.1